MKKKSKNVVTINNYLVVGVVMVLTVVFVLMGFKIYKNYRYNLYSEPYLLKSKTLILEVTSIEEIQSAFKETPTNYFILISKTGNEEVYNLEKKLKPIIDRYNLKDIFYYIDATNMIKQENYLTNLNQALGLDNQIKDIPTILYFNNGKIVSDGIIEKNEMIGELERLIDIYEIGM